jgi:hypothetical protein
MLVRPAFLLRLEACFVLLASAMGFSLLHGSWLIFALLFLAPDISLLGYMARNNLRMGAALYNAAHSYIGPAMLSLLSWRLHSPRFGQLAAIWMAHIAFDRLLGYGLKYSQAFKPTHLQSAASLAGTPRQSTW